MEADVHRDPDSSRSADARRYFRRRRRARRRRRRTQMGRARASACDLLARRAERCARAQRSRARSRASTSSSSRARAARKRLLVADMDSTMIDQSSASTSSPIMPASRAEVAAVTERAMRGELDFEAALDARVALLEGLDEDVIDRCHDERVRITPGAKALVRTMRAHGAHACSSRAASRLFADRSRPRSASTRAVSNRARHRRAAS